MIYRLWTVTEPLGGAVLFDVVVVGGGIIGAGIARDAALRGLTVALVEKHDLGSGTTSGSTRLIHGGLRYLASADFRLVRMDMRERETLLRIAPHLVKPLPFLLPLPKHRFGRWRLRIGMHLYDALSYDKTLPSHRILSPDELSRLEPSLDATQFHGAALFYDCQVHSPERLTLENAIDAAEHGAVVQTYTEVVGAIHDGGRLTGVKVREVLTARERDIRGRLVVNASGPWFDRVAGRIDHPKQPRVRTTKGVHVACEPFTNSAVFLESALDGRAVFAIPWAGHTWLGTTDTDFEDDPATASATADEVQYLVDSVAPYLPAARTARKYWTCAGVRALARADGSASAVSRMHRIAADAPGLVSVIGGKLTGYRAIAEEVVDAVCRQLGHTSRSSTAVTPLPGGDAARRGPDTLEAIYGGRASRVRALADAEPALAQPLAPGYPDIAAQVVYAVRHEWCTTLDDFVRRRSYLGFRPDRGEAALADVSRTMAQELGWSEERRRAEYDAHVTRADRERKAL
jgi:glycerol-3-phosphate dehydrogenase